LILAALVLAMKYFDDSTWSVRYMASVGGVDALELQGLEIEFAMAVAFDLYVALDVYAWYRQRIVNFNHLQQRDDFNHLQQRDESKSAGSAPRAISHPTPIKTPFSPKPISSVLALLDSKVATQLSPATRVNANTHPTLPCSSGLPNVIFGLPAPPQSASQTSSQPA
jgi:Cyclin